MAPAKYLQLVVNITAPYDAVYKYSAEENIFLGWKAVCGIEEEKYYSYFKNMKDIELKNLYLSAKVKLRDDVDDLRTTSFTVDGNVISLLCGKISYIPQAYEIVKREISVN